MNMIPYVKEGIPQVDVSKVSLVYGLLVLDLKVWRKEDVFMSSLVYGLLIPEYKREEIISVLKVT